MGPTTRALYDVSKHNTQVSMRERVPTSTGQGAGDTPNGRQSEFIVLVKVDDYSAEICALRSRL